MTIHENHRQQLSSRNPGRFSRNLIFVMRYHFPAHDGHFSILLSFRLPSPFLISTYGFYGAQNLNLIFQNPLLKVFQAFSRPYKRGPQVKFKFQFFPSICYVEWTELTCASLHLMILWHDKWSPTDSCHNLRNRHHHMMRLMYILTFFFQTPTSVILIA